MIKDFEMKYLELSGWAQNVIRSVIGERQSEITDRKEENHVMESRL